MQTYHFLELSAHNIIQIWRCNADFKRNCEYLQGCDSTRFLRHCDFTIAINSDIWRIDFV